MVAAAAEAEVAVVVEDVVAVVGAFEDVGAAAAVSEAAVAVVVSEEGEVVEVVSAAAEDGFEVRVLGSNVLGSNVLSPRFHIIFADARLLVRSYDQLRGYR